MSTSTFIWRILESVCGLYFAFFAYLEAKSTKFTFFSLNDDLGCFKKRAIDTSYKKIAF